MGSINEDEYIKENNLDGCICINGVEYYSDLWKKRIREGHLECLSISSDKAPSDVFVEFINNYQYCVYETSIDENAVMYLYLYNGYDDTIVKNDYRDNIKAKYLFSDLKFLEKLMDDFIKNGEFSADFKFEPVKNNESPDDPIIPTSYCINDREYDSFDKWLTAVKKVTFIETLSIFMEINNVYYELCAEFIDHDSAYIEYVGDDDFFVYTEEISGTKYKLSDNRIVDSKYVYKGYDNIIDLFTRFYKEKNILNDDCGKEYILNNNSNSSVDVDREEKDTKNIQKDTYDKCERTNMYDDAGTKNNSTFIKILIVILIAIIIFFLVKK